MKYLVNALNFSVRNWMLIIPLYVLTALAALISGAGATLSLGTISDMMTRGGFNDPDQLIRFIPGILTAAIGGSIVSFLVQFAIYPISYGLVNKSLETGNTNLNDMGNALKENFVKYLLYFVGQLVVFGVFFIAAFLVTLLLGLIFSVLGGIGLALMALVILALFLAYIVLNTLLCLWFSAMVIDNLDVVASAKKSVEIVKSFFWTVLGINVLVLIAGSIVGGILGFVNIIPLLGPIIFSIVPSAQTFISLVFYIMFYRDKTGRIANA
ncbi:MAG: hypothetical protein ACM3XR_08425 [Bacillota bacterium]